MDKNKLKKFKSQGFEYIAINKIDKKDYMIFTSLERTIKDIEYEKIANDKKFKIHTIEELLNNF